MHLHCRLIYCLHYFLLFITVLIVGDIFATKCTGNVLPLIFVFQDYLNFLTVLQLHFSYFNKFNVMICTKHNLLNLDMKNHVS